MNTLSKRVLYLLPLLCAGFFMPANAQRENHRGSSQNNNFGRAGSINQRSGATNWSSGNRQANSSFDRQSRQSSFTPRASSGNSVSGNATAYGNRRSQTVPNSTANVITSPNNVYRQPATRNVIVNNNVSVNNATRINNNYRYGSSSYRYPQRTYASVNYNYAPRRYVYAGAPRYAVLPHGSLTIRFGGYPYYYHSGLFYSRYDGFYQPVFAPFGIHVSILPFGYFPIYLGTNRYYYYDGVYYQNRGASDYEVVDAPVGAQVSVLPKGAGIATVNGEKFYEFNGTYYREGINSKNEVVYTVVGKHGEINNTTEQQAAAPSSGALHVGDIVPVLPDGCREVTIDGKQLYLSPDNTYFKAIDNKGDVSYQIVGLEAKN